MNEVKKTELELEKNIIISKILKLDKTKYSEKLLLKIEGYLDCLEDLQVI